MLKKNDEKINGFLLMIEFPFLLYILSFYRFESYLCVPYGFKNSKSA